MQNVFSRGCCVFILATGVAMGQQVACPASGTDKVTDLIGYLGVGRTSLPPECLVAIIYSLGPLKDPSAVDALVPYLDFVDTRVQKLKSDIATRIPWMEEFPAALSLYAIGKPAEGGLVAAIERGDTNEIVRTNAAQVLAAIYREDLPKAVGVLSHASRMSGDAAASGRLFEAARRIAESVKDNKLRAQCELALYQ